MKITRERKIYASICGLAVVLFAADQLFNSKHADAASPAAEVAVPIAAAPAAPMNVSASAVNSLALRLRNIAQSDKLDLNGLIDAFRGGSTPAVNGEVSEGFKSSHKLMALMVSGRGGSAIINGKCIRVGETLDGYKLESVADGRAVLTGAMGRMELMLKAADAATDNASLSTK